MSLTPSGLRPVRKRSNLRLGVIAVMFALLAGTLGFCLVEGWSPLDSLYVTAQTLTTVGYGDLTPNTKAGRIFATALMIGGVGIVLYALTSAVQTIVHSELLETFGQRRQSRKMSKLHNHFIICGAGRDRKSTHLNSSH